MDKEVAAKTLSIYIARDPDRVYDFASTPENLPLWAGGLCKSIRQAGAEWLVETPMGEMRMRFAPRNDFRVLDHYVYTAAAAEVYIPMRVLAHGSGSEVIFTLFRQPDMSDEKYAEDADLVSQDLQRLKEVQELA